MGEVRWVVPSLTWGLIAALNGCTAPGKLLSFSGPQFPLIKVGLDTYFIACAREWSESKCVCEVFPRSRHWRILIYLPFRRGETWSCTFFYSINISSAVFQRCLLWSLSFIFSSAFKRNVMNTFFWEAKDPSVSWTTTLQWVTLLKWNVWFLSQLNIVKIH